jgi:hypothetical protein
MTGPSRILSLGFEPGALERGNDRGLGRTGVRCVQHCRRDYESAAPRSETAHRRLSQGASYGAAMGSLILSIVSIAIALLSVVLSYYVGARNTRASERSAAAAEESRRIAEQQLSNAVLAQEAAMQPYVWADLRPRDDGQMLVFVVGNAGPTVATDVRVKFDPPLEDVVPEGRRERAHLVADRLSEGLRSIAPGRTFMWNLGVGIAFFSSEEGDSAADLAVTVSAVGPAGRLDPVEYVIALEDLRHQASRAVGVALLEQPLKRIADALKKQPGPL